MDFKKINLEKYIVIYHGRCPDGWTARLAAEAYFKSQKYIDIIYYEGNYSDIFDVNLCQDRTVYLVDFSFPPEILLKIKELCSSLIIIDHHVSAHVNIMKYVKESLAGDWSKLYDEYIYDIDRSGAGLTWEYFHGKVPMLAQYIEDRDIHTFKLKDTASICAYLNSIPYDVDIWLKEINFFESPTYLEKITATGAALNALIVQNTQMILRNAYKVNFCGHNTYAVNTSILQSHVANYMYENMNVEFGIAYFTLDGENIIVSLRSAKDGFNCLELAEKFGGGGHRAACGFMIKLSEMNKIFIPGHK